MKPIAVLLDWLATLMNMLHTIELLKPSLHWIVLWLTFKTCILFTTNYGQFSYKYKLHFVWHSCFEFNYSLTLYTVHQGERFNALHYRPLNCTLCDQLLFFLYLYIIITYVTFICSLFVYMVVVYSHIYVPSSDML